MVRKKLEFSLEQSESKCGSAASDGPEIRHYQKVKQNLEWII